MHIKPKTFEEYLVTRTHDIVLNIKANTSESISIEELENDTNGSKIIIDKDEKSVTSNLTTIIFKVLHFVML